MQCSCLTLQGHVCKRIPEPNSIYCWQHRKSTANSIKDTSSQEYIKFIEIQSRPENSLSAATCRSLSTTYYKCFDRYLTQLIFLPPSILYLVSSDSDFNKIIATAALSEKSVLYPGTYVFNVCTHPDFQRRGIARRLFDRIFRDFQGSDFYLEVDPANLPAKKLYQQLGFEYVYNVKVDSKVYDLMIRKR